MAARRRTVTLQKLIARLKGNISSNKGNFEEMETFYEFVAIDYCQLGEETKSP
jgi:hypothetical protein